MSLLLTKSLSQLILPPGGLILLGLLGLLFYRRVWGRVLIFLSLLLFWLLATEPVRDALLQPLEQAYPSLQLEQLPAGEKVAIALLGGGIYEKAPEYGGQDSLSGYAMMRTLYAADLAARTGFEIYTSGGAVLSETTEPEGVVMKRWLMRLGVSDTAIHVDDKAMNTWQNAENLKRIMAEKGINTIILITTAWHIPRAMMVFQAQGLRVIAAPCDYKVEQEPYDLRSYLPRWGVFSDSCDGLHEYLGLSWYRLKMLLD